MARPTLTPRLRCGTAPDAVWASEGASRIHAPDAVWASEGATKE